MKTITHPCPQYQQYNKVLQYINFPISFGFSVQNLWITALMISYQTPNLIDSFIWIMPNIISILIRPPLITYVHKVFSPRQAQLALVSHFLFAGALGCGLIAASSQYFEDVWRIVVCAIGWTLMDVSFQMAGFFCEKATERLEKLGYKQYEDHQDYSSTGGQVLGYLLSFIVCLIRGGKTMKRFYQTSAIMYTITGAITLLYWIILYSASRDRLTLQQQVVQAQSIIPRRNVAEFLPGYYELTRCGGYDRWLLALHFTYLFIVDTLLIYGSMWIILVYESNGDKEGLAYNLGMKEGSMVLLTYTGLAYVNPLTRIFNRFILPDKLKYFKYLLTIICVSSLILFSNTAHQFIFWLSSLIGMTSGLYNKQIQPQIAENYPVFQSCKQIVQRMEKIFILCPMPFVVMMVLRRDDISDCLVCLPLITGCLLVLGMYWRDKEEPLGKVQRNVKEL